MKAIVLGSAAGGGYPQWNCSCKICALHWEGDPRVRRRTQSSVAVTVDGTRFAFLNCSPDIREQIAATPQLWPNAGAGLKNSSFPRKRESRLPTGEHVASLDSRFRGNDAHREDVCVRHSPITDIVLTNADIDHIAGLLTLREMQPLTIWASLRVQEHLKSNSVFSALNSSVVKFQTVYVRQSFSPFDGLDIEAFEVPGKVPLYQEASHGHAVSRDGNTIGLHVRSAGKQLSYVPGCGDIDQLVLDDLKNCDALLFDGTLWQDDEMITSGTGQKTGRRMGHVPVSGDDGSIKALVTLAARTRYFVHMNNTNPLLIDRSPERLEAEASDWGVSYDGLEIVL
jgi:pyrroloquinoline quinone biosynthesis protein B